MAVNIVYEKWLNSEFISSSNFGITHVHTVLPGVTDNKVL